MKTMLKRFKKDRHFSNTSVLIVSMLIIGFVTATLYVMYQGM